MINAVSFLASTHYTNYDPWLFAINLTALIVLAIIPKLPQVRQSGSVCTSVDTLAAPPTTCEIYGNGWIWNGYSCHIEFSSK